MEHMEKVHILDHPLLQHKLCILRDENTGVKDFREVVSEIATLMCYEATRDLPLADVGDRDPRGHRHVQAAGRQEAGHRPRPPCGPGHGRRHPRPWFPPLKRGPHRPGARRGRHTGAAWSITARCPWDIAERDVIILDPMLATGGSASAAIQFIKNYDVKHIKLMNIIAAPQGTRVGVHKDHPDVDIYVAAVDEKLNDHGYIVPGLGDAGDRIFGTK